MQDPRNDFASWSRFALLALCAGVFGCQNLLGEDFSGYQARAEGYDDELQDAAPSPDAGDAPDAAVELPASCSNGLLDGDETDLDCGGDACAPCAPGGECGWAGDCSSGVCMGSVCQTASCLDFVKNGTETDLDCGGGVCNPCERDQACVVHEDCATGFCANGVCTDEGCVNGKQDAGETDVDCGGGVCAPCGAGASCVQGSDCTTGTCVGGVCQEPSCTDGILNGQETSVDCGGSTCLACLDGAACELPRDCQSRVCGDGTCRSAACGDGVSNGAETDTDCGGDRCPACLTGANCTSDNDCASGNCSSGTCASCVDVTTSGASTYCIDATEVTQGQYEAFLAAKAGNTAGQPGYCAWNSSFAPSTSEGGCTASSYNPATKADYPMTCVDWCDAAAYCAFAGLRLCGGVQGGSSPYGEYANPNVDQWHNACSSQGTNTYPYAGEYAADACNTAERGVGAAIPVASAATCRAPAPPFSRLRDMTGNVWEWQDACEAYLNKNDVCRMRGGSYGTSTPACDRQQTARRRTASADVGFRCCS